MAGNSESQEMGWKKRGIYDEPKLSEIAAMYKELGFQVRLEPLDLLNQTTGCSECMKSSPDRYRVLYTHR
ncbi:MAG: hypothetical protein V1793_09165 [Pseudomonadota bacterium]